jgi:tetratricopeptide (TPR) repeat protein
MSLINFLVLLTLIIIIVGCYSQPYRVPYPHYPRPVYIPEKDNYVPKHYIHKHHVYTPQQILSGGCQEILALGTEHFDKHQDLEGLDVSNFFQATSVLEQAKDKCAHAHEDRQQDVIYQLASAYFYVGEYRKSMNNYENILKMFPAESVYNKELSEESSAEQEYRFLKGCWNDPYIDNYRKAEVYRIHNEEKNAAVQYEIAKKSTCAELKRRSKEEGKILRDKMYGLSY